MSFSEDDEKMMYMFHVAEKLSSNVNIPLLNDYAHALRFIGWHKKPLDIVKRIILIDKLNVDAIFTMLRILVRQNKLEEASKNYKFLLENVGKS
jgi:hypothetical protein